jgi:hypothetical protein
VISSAGSGQGSGALQGVLSQQFSVPNDALALRFTVFGGHAHVRLRDASGNVLDECPGLDATSPHIPVSWDLVARRGQTLSIAIEDDLTTNPWGYVAASGFDVVRELNTPLHNAQFLYGLSGWETIGDAANFSVYDDYNYSTGLTDLDLTGVPAYGMRHSVNSYPANQGSSSMATLSQTFQVPVDALALRFNVSGGRSASVNLSDSCTRLYSVSANDSDAIKVAVSWDLVPYRGKTVHLSLDDAAANIYGYITSTGFDLITSFNGP